MHSKIKNQKSKICCLTIAGSDSGGGAGVQADLKVFAALRVHGASVVTSVTAQNPRRVLAVDAVRPAMVRRQLEAVFEELPPRACKTGMLLGAEIVRVVARFFHGPDRPPLVVDPVMGATSGRPLLNPAGVKALRRDLLPLARLVTPNVPEAEALSGMRIKEPEDMRRAARVIHESCGCAVLIKGGHLRGVKEAVDILYDGRQEWMLAAPRVEGDSPHGAGCAYAAAIAGYLGLGHGLAEAVALAKGFITRAIVGQGRVGRHAVLGWKI